MVLNPNTSFILLRCPTDLYGSQGAHIILTDPLCVYCHLYSLSRNRLPVIAPGTVLGDDNVGRGVTYNLPDFYGPSNNAS